MVPDEAKGLADYLKAAEKQAAVRIETDAGEYYLIAPRARGASAPEPFRQAGHLLDPPVERAAYSDRTAWLMACLSELAYLKFEDSAEQRARLLQALSDADLALVEQFDDPDTGTEAFLAERPGWFRALVFRGTEKDHRDILVDLDARFLSTPSGRAHRGFATAYESIRRRVVQALERETAPDTEARELFIAGHSLGGALATAAAQDLESRFVVSACYTYGSPRVGTSEWSDRVKTPIYRVVNGADGVPAVPATALLGKLLLGVTALPVLSAFRGPVERFLQSGFVGYQHAGDLRFLTGDVGSARLKIGSAATVTRLRHIVLGKLAAALLSLKPRAVKSVFLDHSIRLYVGKLRSIARDRNQ